MPAKTDAVTVDPSASRFKPHTVPTEWTSKYSAEDKAAIKEIIEWLNNRKRAGRYLSTAASLSPALVNMLLNGNYTGHVTTNLTKLMQTIRNIDERKTESGYTPFVETSVSRIVNTACKQARVSAMFSVVAANVGTGKTRALKEYAEEHANTWMVESYPGMNTGCLVDELVEKLGIKQFTNYVPVHRKFKTVVSHIAKIENGLLILDEAETVNPKSLETIRRLMDLGNIGVVLAGTSQLYSLIKPEGGQFDQIRSRAPFFPEPIFHITKDDARAIVSVSFDDRPEIFDEDGDLREDIFNAFWSLCDGSMRMLVNGLIPNIKRYGIPQHNTVSADVVYAVAKKALNLSPKRK